jgi:hypothetical protein
MSALASVPPPWWLTRRRATKWTDLGRLQPPVSALGLHYPVCRQVRIAAVVRFGRTSCYAVLRDDHPACTPTLATNAQRNCWRRASALRPRRRTCKQCRAQLCGLRRGDRSTRFLTTAVLSSSARAVRLNPRSARSNGGPLFPFDQRSILADAAAADALVIRTVISLDRSRKYNQRVVFRRMVTLSVPGLATASDSLPLPSKSPTAIIPGL